MLVRILAYQEPFPPTGKDQSDASALTVSFGKILNVKIELSTFKKLPLQSKLITNDT